MNVTPLEIQVFYSKAKSQKEYLIKLLHESGYTINIMQEKKAIFITNSYHLNNILMNWFILGEDGKGEMVCFNKNNSQIYLIPENPPDDKHAIFIDYNLKKLINNSIILKNS